MGKKEKKKTVKKELVQVLRPSPDQGRSPTLGCTKSFRVKLELELKAQQGKGERERGRASIAEGERQVRKGWRN